VQAVALAPLQVPPQADPVPVHAVRPPCGAPLGTVVQVPGLLTTSHAWHCPVHAESQQRPSTQKPLVHWPGAVHVAPLPLLGRQVEEAASQWLPGEQSTLAEQAVRQSVPVPLQT
jgi:hypothetical protein